MNLHMSEIVESSKIYSQGMTTVPKALREELELKEGDLLAWRYDSKTKKLRVEKIPYPGP